MTPPTRRVLLCATDNRDRALVAAAVAARGAIVETFDPTHFPGTGSLSFSFVPVDGQPFDAVWNRFAVGARLPAMEPGVRETCVSSAEMLLTGWLDTLGARQLDPVWAQSRADNKPYQLNVARQVGLEVPATLVSNDPAEVRAFAKTHGPLVTKMLVQPIGEGGTDEADVVFTSTLDASDLDGLEWCPMIFQEQVPNAGDIRATIIGDQLIAAIHHAPPGETDWRRSAHAAGEDPVWSPIDLPPETATALTSLIARLGLAYGAADLVRRPDGSHSFLEVNASGSFAFLGDPTAARIAHAIAAWLVPDPIQETP